MGIAGANLNRLSILPLIGFGFLWMAFGVVGFFQIRAWGK